MASPSVVAQVLPPAAEGEGVPTSTTTRSDTRPVARRPPSEVRRWLASQPSADELADAFPDLWASVQSELGVVLAAGDPARAQAYVTALSTPQAGAGARRAGHGRSEQDVLRDQIRAHLAVVLLGQVRLQTATGVTEGKVRFNFFNGFIAQRLLFAEGLRRKPVSMRWFRLLWPLVWQKPYLMPLVEKQGIYCFYSADLISALADLIGGRSCVEIAAGDGTLSRFLRDVGVEIAATDDHSWKQHINFPDDVTRQDAVRALRRRRPEVVLCSWPPAGNTFEREVFVTDSVDTYVVIGSASEANSGNWADYRKQTAFDIEEAPGLGRLIVPPELDTKVWIFRRRATPR